MIDCKCVPWSYIRVIHQGVSPTKNLNVLYRWSLGSVQSGYVLYVLYVYIDDLLLWTPSILASSCCRRCIEGLCRYLRGYHTEGPTYILFQARRTITGTSLLPLSGLNENVQEIKKYRRNANPIERLLYLEESLVEEKRARTTAMCTSIVSAGW